MKLSSLLDISTAIIATLAAFACTSNLDDELGGGGSDAGVPGNCPAGMHSADDNEDECEPCDVGTYCEAGSRDPRPCVEGTWDHDADPATLCAAWTNCLAGQYIAQQGTPTRDRRCVACDTGRFSLDPNSADCSPWTPCEPGFYVRVGGTPSADQVCSPCASGRFSDEPNSAECVEWSDCEVGEQVAVGGSAATDRQCEACPDDSFSTSENAPMCSGHRICEPGNFVDVPGTATTDAACSGCPSGTYSDEDNAEACTPWTDCQPGEFVQEVGSATHDRVCEACPPDTESFGLNSGSCVALGECPPGTVVVTPSTETEPAECEDCQAGQFCAGENAEAVDCGEGDWDDDEDPATPCVAKTVCPAGEYIVSPGDAVTDRTCDACEDGSFSDEPQSPSCSEWQHCEPGTYMAAPGTRIMDRDCRDCAAGTFTSAQDEPACEEWSVCTAPNSYVETAPSASNDRECGLCDPPEVTPEDNWPECRLPEFQMSDGLVSMEAESFHVQDLNDSSHQWELTTAPDASGESCMDLNPEVQYMWPDDSVTEFAPRLDFRVNFTTTGTFYVHLRADPGNGGGGSDSCVAGIDGSASPAYDFDDAENSWSWRSQSFTVNTEGQHIVSVWGREDGLCLDKIIIKMDNNTPPGDGAAQSPQR